MLRSKLFKNINRIFHKTPVLPGPDDSRLIGASVPVFLFASLILADSIFSRSNNGFLILSTEAPLHAEQSQTYPVLIEQLDDEKIKTERIRALSDKNVEGRGGITDRKGFHTLTAYDTLSPVTPGRIGNRNGKRSRQQNRPDESDSNRGDSNGKRKVSPQMSSSGQEGEQSEQDFKIPANYYFRQDFAFRFDDRGGLAVPTREMAGFRYFQKMLRKIQETFAPPGLNYAYRDFAGTVVSQPIKAQSVKVLFSIDFDGIVRDVRVVSSMGQYAVDQACVDVLNGKNFGKPPAEIFASGHIFGINFIFPPVYGE